MKCRLLLALLLCSQQGKILKADPLISFSFKPFSLYSNTTEPLVIPKNPNISTIERSFYSLVAGIPVSYGGYLTTSDLNGLVSLPRKHEKPSVSILITTRITPIVMGGLTIHHWEREEGTSATLYTFTRAKNTKKQSVEWTVQKENLPKSLVIKPATIIIFADPESIVIPEGIFPTVDQPNLILPDLFVKKEIIINQRTLYLMNIKQFFGSISPLYTKKPQLYQKHLGYEKH